jgi:hypothetical protein
MSVSRRRDAWVSLVYRHASIETILYAVGLAVVVLGAGLLIDAPLEPSSLVDASITAGVFIGCGYYLAQAARKQRRPTRSKPHTQPRFRGRLLNTRALMLLHVAVLVLSLLAYGGAVWPAVGAGVVCAAALVWLAVSWRRAESSAPSRRQL